MPSQACAVLDDEELPSDLLQQFMQPPSKQFMQQSSTAATAQCLAQAGRRECVQLRAACADLQDERDQLLNDLNERDAVIDQLQASHSQLAAALRDFERAALSNEYELSIESSSRAEAQEQLRLQSESDSTVSAAHFALELERLNAAHNVETAALREDLRGLMSRGHDTEAEVLRQHLAEAQTEAENARDSYCMQERLTAAFKEEVDELRLQILELEEHKTLKNADETADMLAAVVVELASLKLSHVALLSELLALQQEPNPLLGSRPVND